MTTPAEIESARKWAREYTQEEGGPSCAATIMQALDALAREPGLEEQVASWQRVFDQVVVAKQTVVAQLEAAEAKLAALRAAATPVVCGKILVPGVTRAVNVEWLDALRAAVEDDAVPSSTPTEETKPEPGRKR